MIRFILLGLLSTTLGFAQLNDNSRQELLQKNILANAGFESGKQRWTASGGTFTAVTSGVGTGKGAVTWDSSSASQTLTSTAVTLPSGFYAKNGVASCAIKTTSGSSTHTIQAYDGSNILASQTITSSTSAFARSSVNFIMPSSGSISLRVVSVASNEPEATIDDCFLGLAEGFNVGEVSQATLVGTLKYASASNCQWSGSSGSFANFSADTDCSTPTVTGSVTAPGTKIPAIVLNNLAPGKYLINFQGKVYSSAALGACSYRLSDGTNVSGNSASYLGSAGTAGPISALALSGVFEYSVAQSSVTIQAQQLLYSGGGSCNINNDVASSGDFEVQVFRFPSATEQAYRPESKNLLSTLKYAATANCFWSGSSATFANYAADTDCPTPTVTGLASAPGTKIPGMTVNNLPAGKYLVQIQGKMLGTSSGNACAMRVSDGTSVAGSSFAFAGSSSSGSGVSLSGVFSYSGIQSSVTFQIQYALYSGAGGCDLINDNANGGDFQINLIPLEQNIPAPLLVGSVTSNSVGAERIERIKLTYSAGVPAITSQSGSWISSITDNGTGDFTLNIASGIFSSTPTCICTSDDSSGFRYCQGKPTTTSSVTVRRFGILDDAGTLIDPTTVDVMCLGTK